MKNVIKIVMLAIVLILNLGSGSNAEAAVIAMTFANNANPTAAPLPFTAVATNCTSPYTAAFSTGNEFRYIAAPPSGTCGVVGGMYSAYIGNGDEQWLFDGTTGLMTDTMGFPTNPGSSNPGGSAAPTAGTNSTIGQSFPFLGVYYYLLAPTTTSPAGSAYGPASISFNGDNFNVLFPVLEEQWNGTWFAFNNIDFQCAGANSGTFTCFAEHMITAAEDNGAGYEGFVMQWETHGTITTVPVPAALWLFSSGLIGLFGFLQRHRTP